VFVECKLVQPLWKSIQRFLRKTKNRTTTWSCFSTPSIYPKENKSAYSRDTMFIAALFTIFKLCK
jgi:hypothetical protein